MASLSKFRTVIWSTVHVSGVAYLYIYQKKPVILKDPFFWIGFLGGILVINFVMEEGDEELVWVKNPERR